MTPKGERSTYCEACGDFHEPLFGFDEVRVGEPVPDYEFEALIGGNRGIMRLSDFRGSWLILLFYPGDFSEDSLAELAEMGERSEELKELATQVLALSTDTLFTHEAWLRASPEAARLPFPLGSDPSGKIASAFSALVEGGELPFSQGEGTALRATYLIDPQGVLRTMEVLDVSLTRSVAETLRKLKGLQAGTL